MNGFCHIELPTTDLDRASRFYSELFGWSFSPIPGLEYQIFNAPGGAIGGGVQKVQKVPANPGYHSYVEVEDIDAVLKKAESLGGKIVQPKQPLPDASWGATGVLETEDGFQLGLWAKS